MKLTTAILTFFLGISTFSYQVNCDYEEKDPEYADDDADSEQGPPPKIISTGQHMVLSLGDTITLPCRVLNRENAVVQWRRYSQGSENEIETPLFFDQTPQIKDKRFSIDDQLTVHLKDIKQEDAGRYTCQILGEKDQIIEYTIEISSVPKILRTVPEGPLKVLKKGQPLTLMCDVIGYPKPSIMWTHKKKHATEEEKLEGESITYDQVSRKTSGEYTCTATNVKGSDQKTVTIEVQYEPEIEIEKDIVNSAEGYESELVCTVHAHPPAKVAWLKDDRTVSESHHISQTNEGNQHFLRISNTKNSDFGTYKCVARNDIGLTNRTIVLSGKPSRPVFLSQSAAEDNKSPVLTWRVASHSPITSVELLYKQQQYDKWDSINATILPDGENAYLVTQTMRNLEPGTYLAQIRAKNVYGWSSMSEPKVFPGDIIGESGAMQSNYLESTPLRDKSAANNLEMRISVVFILSLFVAHLLS